MNDRLKFRVWDNIDKRYILTGCIDISKGILSVNGFYEKNRFVIEQSTGLKDKNGKLVFENDIVDILFNDGTIYKGLVVWRNYEFIFITKYHNMVFGKEYCSLMANYESITLVGDIHQDSHLLGGK